VEFALYFAASFGAKQATNLRGVTLKVPLYSPSTFLLPSNAVRVKLYVPASTASSYVIV